PSARAFLPRLRSDLTALCLASRTEGGLSGLQATFADDWSVSVVLASAGYPESSSKGDVISGLEEAGAAEGVEITHAGTAVEDGESVTAGGRDLNGTGLGGTPAEAPRPAPHGAARSPCDRTQIRSA